MLDRLDAKAVPRQQCATVSQGELGTPGRLGVKTLPRTLKVINCPMFVSIKVDKKM